MFMRRIVIPAAVLVGGLFALVVLQWKLNLGDYARSPQLIEVPWGARTIVGGGRAGLDFDHLAGDQATLHLFCASAETDLRLVPDQVSEEVCGVRIRLLGFLEGTEADSKVRAALEVTWDGSLPAEPVDLRHGRRDERRPSVSEAPAPRTVETR